VDGTDLDGSFFALGSISTRIAASEHCCDVENLRVAPRRHDVAGTSNRTNGRIQAAHSSRATWSSAAGVPRRR
jgi:hypothetical protein